MQARIECLEWTSSMKLVHAANLFHDVGCG